VHGEISYEECVELFSTVSQCPLAVTKLQTILALGEEPLPLPGNHPTDCLNLIRQRTRPWTEPEDQRLLAGIIRFGLENWQAVAHFVGSGRNRAQCSQRWVRGLDPRISKRGWTPDDDADLINLVSQHGLKSWAKIATLIGSRSDVQCRYRYFQLQRGNTCQGTRQIVIPMTAAPSPLRECQVAEWTLARSMGRLPGLKFVDSGLALRPFRICGADPTSLEMFLSSFA
jgi:hypothetical protein